MVGTSNSTLSGFTLSAMVGGCENLMASQSTTTTSPFCSSIMLGGNNHCMYNSSESVMIAGCTNVMSGCTTTISDCSNVLIGGRLSEICGSQNSTIINTNIGKACFAGSSVMIGGSSSCMICAGASFIGGGRAHKIIHTSVGKCGFSALVGGDCNTATGDTNHNGIIGGCRHCVGGNNTVIIGGICNDVTANCAAVLGGSNMSIDTTYNNHAVAEQFAIIGTPAAGGSEDVLTWNPTTGKINKVTQASIPSDCRIKTNIEPIENVDLSTLCGISFEFNEKVPQAGECAYGLIAQDVEKAFPLAVKDGLDVGDGEIYKVVNYNQLVPILLEKIKELENRIIILENK
jgi:hypothetical protein